MKALCDDSNGTTQIHYRDKWNRKVLSAEQRRVKNAELVDFIDFINDETSLASDPLFSLKALNVYVEKEEKSHLKENINSYASSRKR